MGDRSTLSEMFGTHPERMPYVACPDCGGELKVFELQRRPSETVLFCPACDWNESLTDMTTVVGEPIYGTGSSTYLHGDFLMTFTADGRSIVENVGGVEESGMYRKPVRVGSAKVPGLPD